MSIMRYPKMRRRRKRRRNSRALRAPRSVSVRGQALWFHLWAQAFTENRFHANFLQVDERPKGIVTKARHKEIGRCVAQKEIRLQSDTQGAPSTPIRDTSTPEEDIGHPSGAGLLDVVLSESKLYIVLEFMAEDLQKHVDKAAPCTAPLAGKLVNGYSCPPFQDTGPPSVPCHGTASQILPCAHMYTASVDVWSTSCIFPGTLMLVELFAVDSEIGQTFRIFRTIGTSDDGPA